MSSQQLEELFNQHIDPIDAPVAFPQVTPKRLRDELIQSWLCHASAEEKDALCEVMLDELQGDDALTSTLLGVVAGIPKPGYSEALNTLWAAHDQVVGTVIIDRLTDWVNANKYAKQDDLRVVS